ncbi:hypothetical protein V1517DRAFT_325425 [Lipomyces orientalis]|uniref:Uncharacterized protein n=1 Tax=Lipomyces orientalis TaxID=1233043 RepID=A0ACC3TM48_9ASCO
MSGNWIHDVAARYRAAAGNRPPVPTLTRPQPTAPFIQSPFSRELHNLSRTPLAFEDQALLDEALEALPLERLYSEAEQAAENDESWGMQDHLIRAVLKWFREDFFTWVNEPACTNCSGATAAIGATAPTPQELGEGAGRVELYECKVCKTFVRFPRYGHPRKLLTFRKGRCGEWAMCFTLLCRSLGSRARWVWCAEDHVWTEVYSETKKRWIHADSCETAWDQPRLYEQGWGKKMSYAIGFSAEGATDVSRRYIRTEGRQLPRNRISESELVLTLRVITQERRLQFSANQKAVLESEDQAEERELQSYTGTAAPASTAELRPRETGAGEWTEARGESGRR